MKRKQRLIAAKTDARKALGALAQDANLADLDKVLDALVGDEDDALAVDESDDELYEDDPDNPGKRRKKVVAAADAPPPTDGAPKPPEVTKAAMDSAIASAVTTATAKVKADMEALYTARKEVSPIVGEVALDSAEAVYKFALDHAGVDTEGVHPSAYRTLVKMSSAEKPKASATLGMDAAAAKDAVKQFPNLSRFGRV